MSTDPPLGEWEEAEALREILRIARGIGHEDFDRDVAPRLRRLSHAQQVRVAAAIRQALDPQGLEVDAPPPAAGDSPS